MQTCSQLRHKHHYCTERTHALLFPYGCLDKQNLHWVFYNVVIKNNHGHLLLLSLGKTQGIYSNPWNIFLNHVLTHLAPNWREFKSQVYHRIQNFYKVRLLTFFTWSHEVSFDFSYHDHHTSQNSRYTLFQYMSVSRPSCQVSMHQNQHWLQWLHPSNMRTCYTQPRPLLTSHIIFTRPSWTQVYMLGIVGDFVWKHVMWLSMSAKPRMSWPSKGAASKGQSQGDLGAPWHPG